jgi:hypothetical protein
MTLSGASPPHPQMNAWLTKNSNLTQAKIFLLFLLRKNISFGLGLNLWLVHQAQKNLLKKPGTYWFYKMYQVFLVDFVSKVLKIADDTYLKILLRIR